MADLQSVLEVEFPITDRAKKKVAIKKARDENEGTAARFMDADLSAVDDAWIVATDAVRLLEAIERRLIDAGAVVELRQLRGLSAQEVALLVARERGTPVEHRPAAVVPAHRVIPSLPEDLSLRSGLVGA